MQTDLLEIRKYNAQGLKESFRQAKALAETLRRAGGWGGGAGNDIVYWLAVDTLHRAGVGFFRARSLVERWSGYRN